jgi:hypothetical protein
MRIQLVSLVASQFLASFKANIFQKMAETGANPLPPASPNYEETRF